MLNRWSEFRKEEKFGRIDHRPALTTMEDSMERAQGWRMEIVKEIARMISEIQAENLDQHRVRDLNDQINKRMRLKRAWEHRIVELGGPNFLGVHPTQVSFFPFLFFFFFFVTCGRSLLMPESHPT